MNGHRRLVNTLGALAITGAIAGLVWLFLDASNLDVSTAPDPAQSVTADLESFQNGDYAAHYASLAQQDRALVTESDWTNRCAEVTAYAGRLESWEVVATDYCPGTPDVLAVTIEQQWESLEDTHTTVEYYILEEGVWHRTMLWDSESVDLDASQ